MSPNIKLTVVGRGFQKGPTWNYVVFEQPLCTSAVDKLIEKFVFGN